MNEEKDIFIEAVQAAHSLPLAVRKQAAAVQDLERRVFDKSYLDFLREQIAREARGPEWTAILTQRLAALSPFRDASTLAGSIVIATGHYRIRVDPQSRQVIHHEVHGPAGDP